MESEDRLKLFVVAIKNLLNIYSYHKGVAIYLAIFHMHVVGNIMFT